RSRHHDDFGTAKLDAFDLDPGSFRFEGPAGQFVGGRYAEYFFDAIKELEVASVHNAATHCAKDSVLNTRRAMNIESEFRQLVDNIGDLLLGRSLFHYNYHKFAPRRSQRPQPSRTAITFGVGDQALQVEDLGSGFSPTSASTVSRSILRDSSIIRSNNLRMASF